MAKEYFDIRLEAKLKNAKLRKARESLKLTIKQVSQMIGINDQTYGKIERMQAYPHEEIAEKICQFYTLSGIELSVEEIFPEQLRSFRPNTTYVRTASVPKLQLESLIETKYLLSESIEKEVINQDLKRQIELSLETLTYRERDVITRYFGLEGKEPEAVTSIAKEYNMSTAGIYYIKNKAIRRLRHASQSKPLRAYLNGEE